MEKCSETHRRSFKDKAKEKLGLTLDKVKNKSIEVKKQLFQEECDVEVEHVETFMDVGHVGVKEIHHVNESTDSSVIEAEMVRKHSVKKERLGTHIQPPGTICYNVKDNDTLAGIAAHYETTPSELAKLNKMGMSRLVFPGQKIYVPDKDYGSNSSPSPCISPTDFNDMEDITAPRKNENYSALERTFYIGGKELSVVQKVGLTGEDGNQDRAPGQETVKPNSGRLDQECHERFIKVSVKHITDGQGVVNGVLLVTPNAIMFDPDVMDRLVMEHGAEQYGMIAPMETIISAAIYHDIAAMKLNMAQSEGDQSPDAPKPEIYHSCEGPLLGAPLSNTEFSSPEAISTSGNNQFTSTEDITVDKKICHSPELLQRGIKVCSSSSFSCKSFGETINHANVVTSNVEAITVPNISDENLHGADVVPIDTQEVSVARNLIHLKGHAIDTEDCNTIKLTDQENDAKAFKNVLPSISAEEARLNCNHDNETDGEEVTQNAFPPPLTPHMTIGNIEYFQYAGPDGSDSIHNQSTNYPVQSASTSTKHNKLVNIPSEPDLGDTDAENTEKPNDDGKQINEDDPKANILSRTWGSISSVGSFVSSSPGISTIVDFSSGLFSRGQEIPEKENEMDNEENDKLCVIDIKDNDNVISPIIEVENVVKVDDKPELFQSLEELIPRPAALYEDPPLYLCLKIGKPTNRRVSKTCPIQSYMKRKRKPEYWFSIPRERVDSLYAFFIQWSPDIYGSEGNINTKDHGFIQLDSEEEELEMVDDYFVPENSKQGAKLITKDWEIVNVEEVKRRQYLVEEDSVVVPDMSDVSTILGGEHLKKLLQSLPPRAVGYSWKLMYSSDKHGFSLKTVYRAMDNIDSPALIVLKDSHDHVFGALTSCALKVSELFYGTGESFLYTFHLEFQKFGWTGENNFFIKGNTESLSIGAGEGSFGLWLDGDIYHGRTQHCQTYNNCILTDSEDFMVKCMEVWIFE